MYVNSTSHLSAQSTEGAVANFITQWRAGGRRGVAVSSSAAGG